MVAVSLTVKDGGTIQVAVGPKDRHWLASVISGEETNPTTGAVSKPQMLHRDLLSPPPGWQGRDSGKADQFPTSKEIIEQEVYGMGAYPIDGDEAIAGQRGIRDKLNIEEPAAKDWVRIAKEIYQRNQGL